jgi:hypothetical protein
MPLSPVSRASSTGRCNTIQCVDSTMLARENHLFGCTRSRPSQGSFPAGLTPTSDFGFCFQCQAGPSLVLHRPIEITRAIGNYVWRAPTMSGCEGTRRKYYVFTTCSFLRIPNVRRDSCK